MTGTRRASTLNWHMHALGIAVLAGLGAVAYHSATVPVGRGLGTIDGTQPAQSEAPTVETDADATVRLPRIDSLAQTRERPLFVAGRRPPATAAVVETGSVRTEGQAIDLVGLMLDASGQRRALIRAPERLAVWAGVGETVDGWRVGAIEDASVILELAGRRQELRLYRNR